MLGRFLFFISNAFGLSNTFLKGNRLRSILSVMGIAIGIFCIVAVLTFAGSMEKNVKKNLETLGLNVIFIEKWPWGFGSGEYKWWDYLSRPEAGMNDYKLFKQRYSDLVIKEVAYQCSVSGITVKRNNQSTTKAKIFGITEGYVRMNGFVLQEGRMFTLQEENSGRNLVIMGAKVAEELFPGESPVGKILKIKGMKSVIIGVFEMQGSMMNQQADAGLYVPITYMRNFSSIGNGMGSSRIVVQGYPERGIEELEAEVTKIMRSIRMLKPSEKNNFALNKMTMFSNQLDSTFVTIDIVSWVLGLFSLIVGMFGIANIMFVSVKERTPIIGVQKALGAKNSFILIQFLYESIVLSIIGGAIGILLAWLVSISVAGNLDFPIHFDANSFLTGISLSMFTGIIAGLLPAIRASKLDPVEAIRS
ncbi:MAG: ABC transporter permease [Flavobacteriales bacterium]|nr:ABC transporter permease [Flavobacteriales bacterium]